MKPLKIMIVEDEGLIALSMKEIIEEWGYSVCCLVDSGEEALKRVESDTPGLVLMDIKINGKLGGIETARILRDRFDTPVIFMSGYMDENMIKRMKGINPAGILSKPVDFDNLQEILKSVSKDGSPRKGA